MKYRYLFVDKNNGHENTYHPFYCDTRLSQEKANHIMRTDGVAGRMGISFKQFLNMLADKGYSVDFWTCECCKNITNYLKNPALNDWDLIEGISGNY
jgi:hypothetical protein